MAKFKDNTMAVFNFIKAHEEEGITAKDIAAALSLDPRQVNGIITGAFARHKEEINGEKVIVPLVVRVEGELEIEGADGSVKHENVKFVKMTKEGKAFNPDAE